MRPTISKHITQIHHSTDTDTDTCSTMVCVGFWGAQSPVQDSSSQVQAASCGMHCIEIPCIPSHLCADAVPGTPGPLHTMAGTHHSHASLS